MTDPCNHLPAEHRVVNLCDEMIHYPSEDYPCSCTGFRIGPSSEVCGECGHAASKHINVRMCRPANGDFCPCRTVIG